MIRTIGNERNIRSYRRIILKLLPVVVPFSLLFILGVVITVIQSLGVLLPPAEGSVFLPYKELIGSVWFGGAFRFTLVVSVSSAVISVIVGTVLGYCVWLLPKGLGRAASVYRIP